MKVEYIEPFIKAAIEVIKAEFGMDVELGELSAEKASNTTQEVTVLIGITGEVEGMVLYGVNTAMASEIVLHLTGESRPVFDEIGESVIAELGNMISGRATANFEETGIMCTISPPSVIVGRGTIISSVNIKRLVIPLHLPIGTLHMAVALRSRN